VIKVLLIILTLGLLIYWQLDEWQENVNIYSSSCETDSGRRLPQKVCKAIVEYRYQKDD